MYIFNTTFHVEDTAVSNFLIYLNEKYIPTAINFGFSSVRLYKVLSQHHEAGQNYSLQFDVEKLRDFELWTSGEGELLNQEIVSMFEHQVAGFITILKQIEIK